MIFVTTGTQLPFDRLVQAVDELAGKFPGYQFIVQARKHEYALTSKNISLIEFISPAQFSQYIQQAELIISHAGIGTIVNASEARKPLIVFPRLASFNEHRNDHQLATCHMMQDSFQLNVANDVQELYAFMKKYQQANLKLTKQISPFASPDLIQSIKSFINSQEVEGEMSDMVPALVERPARVETK